MGDLALMQIAGDQAALMTVLVQAIGARRALEVGTFLGYGAIAIARGLPEDGELVVCEIDQEYADRARGHLADAGLEDRVRIRVAPAIETLRGLPGSEPFDFAFVDADKASYGGYYEECLRLLRPGGLLLLDNVFMGGRILDPEADDEGMLVDARAQRPHRRRRPRRRGDAGDRRRHHDRPQALGGNVAVPSSDEQWARLVRDGMPPCWRLIAEGSGGSVWERGGVAATIVPKAPDRSIFNSVFYEDAGELLDSLGEIAAAYEEAGVRAWTVWVPEAGRRSSRGPGGRRALLRRRPALHGHAAGRAARARGRARFRDHRARGLRRAGAHQRGRLRLPAGRLRRGGRSPDARDPHVLRRARRRAGLHAWRSGRTAPTLS